MQTLEVEFLESNFVTLSEENSLPLKIAFLFYEKRQNRLEKDDYNDHYNTED